MKCSTAKQTVAPDHPAFAGHFPGHPLLPGVVLLAQAQEAACLDPELAHRFSAGSTLTVAKFLAPVGPGAVVDFAFDSDHAGLRFEAQVGSVTVAKGQWRWGGDG